jgi:hypothetical protein
MVALFYISLPPNIGPQFLLRRLDWLIEIPWREIPSRLDFRAVEGDNNNGGFGMGFAPVIAFTFLIFLIGPIRLAPQIIQVRDSVKIPIS